MTIGSTALRALLAAGFLAGLGGAASAQVVPPPVEPVIKHHLYDMGNPGIPEREYTGDSAFLSTPFEAPGPSVERAISIPRLPAPAAAAPIRRERQRVTVHRAPHRVATRRAYRRIARAE